MVEWKKKKKGFAYVYTADGVDRAIVDRRGVGMAAAFGKNVTFGHLSFATVEDAKAYVGFLLATEEPLSC